MEPQERPWIRRYQSAGCSMAARAVILKSRPESAVGFVTSALDVRHPDIPLVTAPLAVTSPNDLRRGPMASSVELKCSNSSSPAYLTNDYDLTCYDDIILPDLSLEHFSNYVI